MEITIRPAQPQEAGTLTALARASNHYWKYPEEYHMKWDQELFMPPSHIKLNLVYVAEHDSKIIGYFSIVHMRTDRQIGPRMVNKGFWLENVFVLPEYIGHGVGSALVRYAKLLCREKDIDKLFVFVEPFSRGFYDKMGGWFVRESLTEFTGRVIPVYILPVEVGTN